jgi:hypothetical protein
MATDVQIALQPQAGQDPEMALATAAVRQARSTLAALAQQMGQSLAGKVLAATNLPPGFTQIAAGSEIFTFKLAAPLPAGLPVTIGVAPGARTQAPQVTIQPHVLGPAASAPVPTPQARAAPMLPGPPPQMPSPAQPTGEPVMRTAIPASPLPAPIAAPQAASAPAAPAPTAAVARAAVPNAAATPPPSPGPMTAAVGPTLPPGAAPVAAPTAIAPQVLVPNAPAVVAPPAGVVVVPSPVAAGPVAAVGSSPLPQAPPSPATPLQAGLAPVAPAPSTAAATPTMAAPIPTGAGPVPAATPVMPQAAPAGGSPTAPPPQTSFPASAATPAPAVAASAMPPTPLPAAAPAQVLLQRLTQALAPGPATGQAPPVAQTPAMAAATAQAAGLQHSAGPLLDALAVHMPRLPTPVAEAAARVLAGRLSLDRGAPSGAALKAAVLKAGVLVSPAGQPGDPPDLKTALTQLKSALLGFLGDDIEPIVPVTRRPPPPARGAPPRAFAPDLPPPGGAEGKDAARSLLGQTDGALARLRLLQLTSHGNDVARPGAALPAPAEWNLELPLLLGRELAMAQIQIGRDGKAQGEARDRGWRLRFALKFSVIGEVGAQIAMVGKRTSVALWADEALTADMLEDMLPELAPALAAKGLELASLTVRRGAPREEARPMGQLMDSRR